MRNNCLSFVGLFFVLSIFVVSCDNSTDDDGGAGDFFNPNGYEYVELGLPSGIKWATCNIGATKPEEYGGYYAWGETEEKSYYDWDTYKWCNGTRNSLTKYCTDSDYGHVDNKTVLDPEDDVAHVKWGGSWRMPTSDEMQELNDNCTWQWTTNGYRVTGPNGNSIFLPAASCRIGADDLCGEASGYYWSSSLLGDRGCNYAYCLYFFDDNRVLHNHMRYGGLCVRPVCE